MTSTQKTHSLTKYVYTNQTGKVLKLTSSTMLILYTGCKAPVKHSSNILHKMLDWNYLLI